MFTGEKVRLRAYKKEDIPLAWQFINKEEILSNIVPNIPYPFTYSDEEKWFNSLSFSNDTYNFAIETLADSTYIGSCGVNEVDWKNSIVKIGIFIGDDNYLGKGYGTDAMKVLIDFIFAEMNINKIKLMVYSFNEPAIRCYEKCGMKKEAVLKSEIFRNGKYFDKIVMSIFKDEYITK